MTTPTGARLQSGYQHTLPLEVDNVSFMLERMAEDCAPLQFLRELTQNSIESIRRRPDQTGDITWDVEWTYFEEEGVYKLCVIDAGDGMTGDEMVQYINHLSSSIATQSLDGNFGVGAKIAAATRNRAGLIYLSWKDSVGSMIHLWKDPETNLYGLKQVERPDESFAHWGVVDEALKPDPMRDTGTVVILLGNTEEHDTMRAPEGAPSPSRWVSKYLNTRYFRFPDGITVRAREGWENPRSDADRNVLRRIVGQQAYLAEHSVESGTVAVTDAQVHWWVLKDEQALSQNSGFIASNGHVAALYQDELYEMQTGRAGTATLQQFGIIFGHNRVVLYVEATAGSNSRVSANTARTHLVLNNEPLRWADWAAEFRGSMPNAIKELMEEVAAGSTASDHKQAIRERLKQVKELFQLTRYKPSPAGDFAADPESITRGGRTRRGGTAGPGTGHPGRKGGRGGSVYATYLKKDGIPANEVRPDPYPEVKWVKASDGTRQPPDLEDRAAKYLPDQNLILANADFRVFTDMIDRWKKQYGPIAGSSDVIGEAVREWFEQTLTETIMGVQGLRNAREWTVADVAKALGEEALTASVMPRWHVDVAIRRALGSKLGSVKDKAS